MDRTILGGLGTLTGEYLPSMHKTKEEKDKKGIKKEERSGWREEGRGGKRKEKRGGEGKGGKRREGKAMTSLGTESWLFFQDKDGGQRTTFGTQSFPSTEGCLQDLLDSSLHLQHYLNDHKDRRLY